MNAQPKDLLFCAPSSYSAIPASLIFISSNMILKHENKRYSLDGTPYNSLSEFYFWVQNTNEYNFFFHEMKCEYLPRAVSVCI
jgi:hypothetical protein